MKLVNNICYVGVKDIDRQLSQNAYVLTTNKTYILIDTVKEENFDQYLANIEQVTNIMNVKYLIVNHSGLDHIGCVDRLLKLNPHIKIIASKRAYYYLRAILEEEVVIIGVGDYDILHIDNLKVSFLMVPHLVWPDTMFTYIDKYEVLFTCDVFSTDMVSLDMVTSKNTYKAHYNQAVISSLNKLTGFKHHLKLALDKIKDFKISYIAPGHGLIIDDGIATLFEQYQEFCSEEDVDDRIVIVYASNHGLTDQVALKIYEYINETDHLVEMYDLNKQYDVALSRMKRAKAILYGSSTMYADALDIVFKAMNEISWVNDGVKLVSSFGSYGWSGEAVDYILVRAKQQRMQVKDLGFKVNFRLKENDLIKVKEYCHTFVKNYEEFNQNNNGDEMS